MSGYQAQLIRSLAWPVLLALGSGCTDVSPTHQAVTDWMRCIECIDGELARVVQLGNQVEPVLAAYASLGPPGEYLDSVRAGENAAYQRVIAAGLDTSRIKNLADTYVHNTIAVYQIRAGMALRGIGGPSAILALDQALAQPLRPDVRTALMALRDSTIP